MSRSAGAGGLVALVFPSGDAVIDYCHAHPLHAACLGFIATAEPRRNAELIHAAIADAAKAKAKLLLTPECALVGYPGAARTDFAGTDWCLVAELEERIEVAAVRAGVAVVLGTAGPAGRRADQQRCAGGRGDGETGAAASAT